MLKPYIFCKVGHEKYENGRNILFVFVDLEEAYDMVVQKVWSKQEIHEAVQSFN